MPKTATYLLMIMAIGLLASPAPAATWLTALGNGKVSGDLRYRYEQVNQNGFADDAQASTLRTRLGYLSGDLHAGHHKLNLFVEFENIATIGADDYNSTRNGLTRFPKVADPTGTELNQAYVDYSGHLGNRIIVGRQRIVLGNHRYVGNVGWRQNEQTYDAARLTNTRIHGLTAHYAYIWNINGITFGDHDVAAHLLQLEYNALNLGKITAYGFLINDNLTPTASSQTGGIRYTGKFGQTGRPQAGITVEHAIQGDYQDAAFENQNYMLGQAYATHQGITLQVAYELLEGDGNRAFQTPLATKHAFNGWADAFLTTPSNGLRDIATALIAHMGDARLQAVYHDFSADMGDADYGTEWDFWHSTHSTHSNPWASNMPVTTPIPTAPTPTNCGCSPNSPFNCPI